MAYAIASLIQSARHLLDDNPWTDALTKAEKTQGPAVRAKLEAANKNVLRRATGPQVGDEPLHGHHVPIHRAEANVPDHPQRLHPVVGAPVLLGLRPLPVPALQAATFRILPEVFVHDRQRFFE